MGILKETSACSMYEGKGIDGNCELYWGKQNENRPVFSLRRQRNEILARELEEVSVRVLLVAADMRREGCVIGDCL
jgi:hypothetical protein